jgi:hypothetical protein
MVTDARAGATCRVGRGDGMGARRATGIEWVERAGLDVRARRTGVRLLDDRDFAAVRDFAEPVFLCRLALVPRARRAAGLPARTADLARTLPFVFFRDDAAFNCFPLFGLWPRRRAERPRNSPGPLIVREL